MSGSQGKPIFEKEYMVYWSETDAAGIMHFSNYLRVCERVEEEFYFSTDMGRKYRKPSRELWFPRVHAECDYKSPLQARERYKVSLEDILIGESSLVYTYNFRHLNGSLAASCKIVVVAVTGFPPRKTKVPREMVEKLLRLGARLRSPPPEGESGQVSG